MNRLFLSIIFILFSLRALACSCAPNNIIQDFFESDVTAIIEIKQTFGDEIRADQMFGARTYKAKVNFLSLFKGNKFEELNIVGQTNDVRSASCEIMIKPGEKYLISLNKNAKGEFWISECSSIQSINREDTDVTVNNYKNLFKYLNKNKKKFENGEFLVYVDETREFNNDTKRIESGIQKLRKKNIGFGLYKIKIDDSYSITEVETIKKLKVNQTKLYELLKSKFKVYTPDKYSAEKKYFIALIY